MSWYSPEIQLLRRQIFENLQVLFQLELTLLPEGGRLCDCLNQHCKKSLIKYWDLAETQKSNNQTRYQVGLG